MKKTKIALISLLGFSLFACQGNNAVLPKEQNVQKAATTSWSTSITNLMKTHLGGTVLPYVNLGTTPTAEFLYSASDSTYGTLYVYCDAQKNYSDFDLTTFETAFTAAGYTKQSGKEAYTKDKVTVLVANEKDGGLALEATYDEDYDFSSTVSYDSDLESEMKSNLDNNTLPFVYLGTAHNTYFTYNPVTYKGSLLGGKWNESVITDNETALTGKSNITVTKLNATLTIEVTSTDTSKFTMKLQKDSTNSSAPKILISFTYYPKFDQGTLTDWTEEINDFFTDHFEGHKVPYLYLGTANPQIASYNPQDYSSLEISGAWYSDKILEEAKTAFGTDGWSYTEVAASTYTLASVTGTKQFDDECILDVTVKPSGYYWKEEHYCTVSVKYTPRIIVPEDKKDWTAATKQNFADFFGSSRNLPYVYLNNPSKDETSYGGYRDTDGKRKVTINGGNYTVNVPSYVGKTLKAEGWTIVADGKNTKVGFLATKANTDGSTFTATMNTNNVYTATLVFSLDEKFSVPESGDWTDSVKTVMNTEFGESLPYFYLGTDVPYTSESDFVSSTNTLSIYGNTWDDSLLTYLTTTYKTEAESKGFTFTYRGANTDSTGFTKYEASLAKSDGSSYRVALSKENNTPRLSISYLSAYSPDSTVTDWPTTVKDAITSQLGTNAFLPYFYMGNSTSLKVDTSSSNTLVITGGTYDKRMLASAKLAFADWTQSEDADNSYHRLKAYKKMSDGTTLRSFFVKSASAASSFASLTIYKDDVATAGAFTSWSQANQTKMQTAFGHVLPVIPLPAEPTFYSSSSFSGSVYGSTLNFSTLLSIQDTLENAKDADGNSLNIKVTVDPNTPTSLNAYNASLTALIPYSDKTLKMVITPTNYSFRIVVSEYTEFTLPASEDAHWTRDIETAMRNNLGFVVPYFYLGTLTPSCSSTYGYVSLTGSTFDVKIIREAEKTFSADQDHTWTIHRFASETSESVLEAQASIDGKNVSVAVKGLTSYNGTKATMEVRIY